ncbi:DNA (cytosine-5-)-methyltransferase [bacterium]|nr:DNA (cytosine-5-)-methyltransferase [bacterium]
MKKTIKYIDLFCGIGGFRYAIENASKRLNLNSECVLSSDIDIKCQNAYESNFGERPLGDIDSIESNQIQKHNILLAGFPCQPFSIIGNRKGFDDTRGTLFFEIARILASKKPDAFILENVKLLVGHNSGQTIKHIFKVLTDIGYRVDFKVLNALNFGLPQKRERVFIVGFKKSVSFNWPIGNVKMKSLDEILEKNVPQNYYASDHIRKKRLAKQKPTKEITIWHENKAGNISAYPYSCALRAGASYNYLLVNGERRLTAREMLRLQGFPDTFKIEDCYTQIRKQAGNSLPIPMAEEVVFNVLKALYSNNFKLDSEYYIAIDNQLKCMDNKGIEYAKAAQA